MILKESFIYGIGGILNRAIGFLLIPLYTGYLTVEEYGALALLGVILQLSAFVGLSGVGAACLRLYHDDANEERQKELYGNATLFLIAWPIVWLLMLVSLGLLSGKDTYFGVEFYPYIYLIIITGFFSPLSRLIIGLFRAQQRPWAFIAFNLGFFVLQSLFIIGLVAYLKMGLAGQVTGQLLANLVMWVVSLFLLFKYGRFHFNKGVITELLKFGIPLIPFFIFLWLHTFAGHYAIQHYMDLKSVGIFFLASQFAGVVILVNTSLSYALAPYFYRVASKDNTEKKLEKLFLTYMSLLGFVGLTMIIVSPPVIEFIASSDYLEAPKFVPPLILASVILSFFSPITWALTWNKKTVTLSKLRVYATLIFLIILIALALQSKISTENVIYSIIFSNIFLFIVGLLIVKKNYLKFLNIYKVIGIVVTLTISGLIINNIDFKSNLLVNMPLAIFVIAGASAINSVISGFSIKSLEAMK